MSEYIYASSGEPLAHIYGEITLAREKIVRCRDCINLEHWKYRDGSERLVCCMVDVHDISEDDFCSQGERKDENGR